MTTMTITPDVTKKRAKLSGTVAAGEHVSVKIIGLGSLASSTTMNLRVLHGADTIAQFPAPGSEDAWTSSGSDLICTLNLNTVQAKAECNFPETDCIFVLEDVGCTISGSLRDPQLFFVEENPILGWPENNSGEDPYDLDAFPGMVRGWTAQMAAWATQMDNFSVSVVKANGVATITVTNKSGVASSVYLYDGAKGDKGDVGNDGTSPSVSVSTISGGHRVVITDAAHPQGQSFDVMDGTGGGGSGTVKSVNSQSPDANGNVTLSAANVGAVAATNGTATNLTVVGSSIEVKETASSPTSKTIYLSPGSASVTMGESGNNAVSISHSGVSVYDSNGQRDIAFPSSEGTFALTSQIPTTASDIGALAEDGTAANATKAESLVEGNNSAFIDASSYSKPRICINADGVEEEEIVANLSDLATKSEMTNLALPYMVDEDGNARSSSYKYSKDENCTVAGVLWKSLYDDNEYEPSDEDHPLPEEVATTETPNGPWWKKERLDAPENAIMVDGDTGVASIIDAKTGEVKWCELTLIPYDQLDRTAGTDGVYQLIQHANNHIKLTTGNSIYVKLPGAVVDNGNEDDDSRVAKVRDLLIDVESTFVPPDFSETETYAQGAFVKYNGKYYKCNTASYTAGAFNSEVFDECGEHGVLFSGTDGTDFNLYVMESSGAASAEEVMRVPFGKRMSIYVTECYPTVTTTTSGTTTTTTSVPCFQVASQVFSKVPAVTPAATTTSES